MAILLICSIEINDAPAIDFICLILLSIINYLLEEIIAMVLAIIALGRFSHLNLQSISCLAYSI